MEDGSILLFYIFIILVIVGLLFCTYLLTQWARKKQREAELNAQIRNEDAITSQHDGRPDLDS